MQTTAVTQATTVTPATSNKDDNNIMTARNSRNESNNRIANTMQTLEKVAKPATTCREANYLRDVINIRDATAAGIKGTSWMFTTPEPSESAGKSAAVEKPTIMHEGCQQHLGQYQQQEEELTTRTLVISNNIWADSSRDNRNIADVNGGRETHKSRNASTRRDANSSTGNCWDDRNWGRYQKSYGRQPLRSVPGNS
jgi:hypothetical protein